MSVILDKHDFVEGPMAAADVAEYSVYILNTKARYKRKNLLPDQTNSTKAPRLLGPAPNTVTNKTIQKR